MIITKFKIEKAVKQFGLGRIVSPPPVRVKQTAFPISSLIESAPVIPLQYKHLFRNGWWGDQGNTSHCVAYSWLHYVHDSPVAYSKKKPMYVPSEVYKWAQENDYWPGIAYDGTSVDAGAKFFLKEKVISEFRWCYTLEETLRALEKWTLVVGTDFYESMFFPNAKGIVKLSGSLAGGHAYELTGFNRKEKLIYWKNSWGKDWGLNGMAKISFEDFERLIYQHGEICAATQNKNL